MNPNRRLFYPLFVVAFAVLVVWWNQRTESPPAPLPQPSSSSSTPVMRSAEPPPELERLQQHVRFLCNTSPRRDSRHPESLQKVARYIEDSLQRQSLETLQQRFRVDGGDYSNVSAFLGPRDRPRLVVGAHYDSHAMTPGADDNASGVAALLELAGRLASADTGDWQYSLEFVAFTLEEPPYFGTGDMGSARHVRQRLADGVAIAAMLSLEMLGYFDSTPGSQRYPHESLTRSYPDTGDFIAIIGRREDEALADRIESSMKQGEVPVIKALLPTSLTTITFSDHRNYWFRGITALMITDTANFRNPHYHQASDTPDTLDYERLQQVVASLERALLDFCR